MNCLEQLVSTLGGETHPEPSRSLHPNNNMLEESPGTFLAKKNPKILKKLFSSVEKRHLCGRLYEVRFWRGCIFISFGWERELDRASGVVWCLSSFLLLFRVAVHTRTYILEINIYRPPCTSCFPISNSYFLLEFSTNAYTTVWSL